MTVRWPAASSSKDIHPPVIHDQRGVSLVELLVGLGIAAGIALFIGTTIWQFFTVTRWGHNRMLVASHHQTALLWLSRDSAEADTFVAGSGAEYGTFYWPGGDPYFAYRYDAAEGTLVRDHYAGGALQSSQTVARSIANQNDVSFSPSGELVTVSITSSQGSIVETVDLQLAMRVP